MKKWKSAAIFALALVPIAAIAGYFTILYQMEGILDPETMSAALEQFGGREGMIAVYVVQTVLYGLVCGFFGYRLSESCGLMKPLRFEKTAFLRAFLWSVAAGALFSLDYWTFGKWIPGIRAAAISSLNWNTMLASVLYGGIMEEVMLRLFVMSLLTWMIWKLAFRKQKTAPHGAAIAANVIAAVLFAAGHLPATAMTFNGLTPLLVFRCFLLNGGFGLFFGWLYQKYGIQYAMLGHGLAHLVSKGLWMLLL